jgi:hypothetical protein
MGLAYREGAAQKSTVGSVVCAKKNGLHLVTQAV